MKIFLDANILIDYFAQREPFCKEANKLRIVDFFGDAELWASAQSFSDIEYILGRIHPVQKVREKMAKSLDFLQIATFEAADVEDALRSTWPDLEDFLIARCAERIKADYLITRDLHGFVDSPVPVLNPAEFFSMLKTKYDIEYEGLSL